MPIVDVSLGPLRGTRRVRPQLSRREKWTAGGRPQYVGRIPSSDAISEEGQAGGDLSGSSNARDSRSVLHAIGCRFEASNVRTCKVSGAGRRVRRLHIRCIYAGCDGVLRV
jgi:hypothetical protein